MSRVLREPIFIGRGPSDSGEGTTQYISNPRKCGPRDSTRGRGGGGVQMDILVYPP